MTNDSIVIPPKNRANLTAYHHCVENQSVENALTSAFPKNHLNGLGR